MREQNLTAGGVADILGVAPAWVTARIDGGELRATQPRGSHPGRPVAELCRISERSLQVFLMGHAHELDASGVDLPRLIGIMAVRNPERRKSPLRRQTQANPDPGPVPYRRWSGEERARLRSLVETHTIHQAAPVLGRSVTSVRVQASRLGLTWGIQEDQFSVRELAQVFGVDIRWVMRRINRRSLRAVTPYGRRPGLRQASLYRVPAQAVRGYLLAHSSELRGRRVDLARIASIMSGPEPVTNSGGHRPFSAAASSASGGIARARRWPSVRSQGQSQKALGRRTKMAFSVPPGACPGGGHFHAGLMSISFRGGWWCGTAGVSPHDRCSFRKFVRISVFAIGARAYGCVPFFRPCGSPRGVPPGC